ncbi:MAG: hypothetical protein GF372_11920 [Candidatus Marinimicrobia bacterium]|nr:hypothetical protein [Candidatus Neomarinimicrobiota bacterium]
MKKTNCFITRFGLVLLVIFSFVSCASQEDKTGDEQLATDSTQVSQTAPATIDSLIEYTADDLRQAENRAQLTLEYTWSYESTGDDHKAFYIPRDIEVASNGDILVLDNGNNRIQVFDSTRAFLRTLGEEGTAPGEFQMPQDLLWIPPDQILVTQPLQKRIQILNSHGEYMQGFMTEGHIEEAKLFDDSTFIASDSRRAGNPEHHLLRIYNLVGEYVRGIGLHKYVEESPSYGLMGVCIALDDVQNIYAGYVIKSHLEKYAPSGELMQSLYFDLPIKHAGVQQTIYDLKYSNRYLYALVANRAKSEKEWGIGRLSSTFTAAGPTNTHYFMNHGVESEETDLYRLLIFDQWGRLVSSNLLTKYVSKITVHQNTLYLVDSFVGMKIYEYAIHLPAR